MYILSCNSIIEFIIGFAIKINLGSGFSPFQIPKCIVYIWENVIIHIFVLQP